jgi:hypothetical protein
MYLTDKDKQKLQVKRWKKIFQANADPKQVGVDILISDKAAFNQNYSEETKKATSY